MNATTTEQLKDFMVRNLEPLSQAFDGDEEFLRIVPILSDEGGHGNTGGGEFGAIEKRFEDCLPWTHAARMSQGKQSHINKTGFGMSDDWLTVEMDYDAAKLGLLSNNLAPITNQLMHQFEAAEKVLRIATAEGVMLDDTGRRARIVSIENATYTDEAGDTLNVSKVFVDPFLCHNRNARDAVKYLHKTQSVDVISWDEATWTGAVVADGADDEGYEIVYIHEDTTASASYVYLYPRLPAEGPEAGQYLAANGYCGQDLTEAKGKATPGLFAQLGNGAVMGNYGAGTHVTCLGSPIYGSNADIDISVNRLTDDRYNFFTGSCYNNSPYMATTDLTEIDLNDSVMLRAFEWHRRHSKAATGTTSHIDILLCSFSVWESYVMAGRDRATLFTQTPMKFTLDVGAKTYTFDAPYYMYQGKPVPLMIVDLLPAQTILGLDTGTLARVPMWAGWDDTAQSGEFPFFTRMTKFGLGNKLRAVYQRKSRFVNFSPSCILSIHNIAGYTPAGS
jgi:hypothetical protein